METLRSSEIPTHIYQTIRSHTPEDGNLDTQSYEKFRFHKPVNSSSVNTLHAFYGSRRFIAVFLENPF
jgi:hypothetical protein